MPAMITISVQGQPAPQGSKRAFAVRGKGGVPTGKIAVIESSHARVKSWRQAVLEAALLAVADSGDPIPVSGPLEVEMTFIMPRPKSHYASGRNAGQLRRSAPRWPSTTPDLSKLIRATEDALTDSAVWRDDAQVVNLHAKKIYALDYGGQLSKPGACITIHAME